MIASFHSAIWHWRTLIQIRDFDPSIHIFPLSIGVVCAGNLIRVDEMAESPKLAE
jgi:hypothetical protein